jgi:hypothetical protein
MKVHYQPDVYSEICEAIAEAEKSGRTISHIDITDVEWRQLMRYLKKWHQVEIIPGDAELALENVSLWPWLTTIKDEHCFGRCRVEGILIRGIA